MSLIRILIADDQSLIRDGLKTVLDLESDFKVIGTARDGLEAFKLVEALRPDVVLLDIRMPEMDGVESIRQIKAKYPEIKVIMLTTFNDEEYIVNALANGASGYLLKDIEIDRLVEFIKDIVKDKTILPDSVAAKLANVLSRIQSNSDRSKCELDLSEREREIAGMMVQGFNNRQIASALYISEGTVRNYISGIYGKIGVGDRTKAVIYLKEHGVG